MFSRLIEAWDMLHAIITLMYVYVEPHNPEYKILPFTPLPHHLNRKIVKIDLLLAQWQDSLDSFFSASNSLDQRDQLAVTQLRITHRTAVIFLNTCCNHDQVSYDQYLPEFAQIVSLAASIIQYHQHSQGHGGLRVAFDIGIIQPLNFLALKCRNRRLRREAIALVEQAGREGVWDGVTMAAILRWVVSQEEENLMPYEKGADVDVDEVPLERDRFHQLKVTFHRRRRRVELKGMRRLDVGDGGVWECVMGEMDCWAPPSEVQDDSWQVVIALFE